MQNACASATCSDKSRGNEICDTQVPRFLLVVFCERVSNYVSVEKSRGENDIIYFYLHGRDRANVKSRWILATRGRTKSHFEYELVFAKIDRNFSHRCVVENQAVIFSIAKMRNLIQIKLGISFVH